MAGMARVSFSLRAQVGRYCIYLLRQSALRNVSGRFAWLLPPVFGSPVCAWGLDNPRRFRVRYQVCCEVVEDWRRVGARNDFLSLSVIFSVICSFMFQIRQARLRKDARTTHECNFFCSKTLMEPGTGDYYRRAGYRNEQTNMSA